MNAQGDVTVIPVSNNGTKSKLLPVIAFDTESGKREVISVKRIIGKSSIGSQKKTDYLKYIQKNESGISPIEIVSKIFEKLKNYVKNYFPNGIKDAVITVPAHFDEASRVGIKSAAELAGIKVIRLLNEPTAAAIAYCVLDDTRERNILVYDLGGGTFDVSIMQIKDNTFRVISTGGKNDLGGDDFDIALSLLLDNKTGHNSEILYYKDILKAREIKENLTLHN